MYKKAAKIVDFNQGCECLEQKANSFNKIKNL